MHLFVLHGTLTINEQVLEPRDGLGISETNSITIAAGTDAEILLVEVPMQIQ